MPESVMVSSVARYVMSRGLVLLSLDSWLTDHGGPAAPEGHHLPAYRRCTAKQHRAIEAHAGAQTRDDHVFQARLRASRRRRLSHPR
jgi:hypothetical protein